MVAVIRNLDDKYFLIFKYAHPVTKDYYNYFAEPKKFFRLPAPQKVTLFLPHS